MPRELSRTQGDADGLLMGAQTAHRIWSVIGGSLALLIYLWCPSEAAAQLDQTCTVSAFNRTARVQADGVWVLPNVPANLGQVRVRATCVENGVVSSGASSFINVPANGVIKVEDINFQRPPPVPASLNLSAPLTVLNAVGQTVQLSAIATYPGGSSADVTSGEVGTDYRTSNPAIATVDANGLVTARASGLALVSAVNEGALGVIRIQVVVSGDSDGDGLPDDWELANGLDPNNPVDALDDQDHDGLSTIAEYQSGLNPFNDDSDGDGLLDGREVNQLATNPLLGDTDGDGFWDGLEIQTGSDPLDPASYNLTAALRGISVSPGSFTLIFNTILGEASRQLVVTGELIDGRQLNITSRRYGTEYASSDLTIANFGAEEGRIYAGRDGLAVITVRNGAFSATSSVTVESFAPRALGWVSVPGFANAVALAGDYAYVAAGAAGIQVVDISNPMSPAVVGALDMPGNANDIAVSGDWAYVADGSGGLFIADISNRTQPLFTGSVALPGPARGLAVRDDLVFVADGRGLRIVDVGVPAAPILIGGIELGPASAVSLDGNLAVVSAIIVHAVDISDPTHPTLLGSTAMGPNYRSGAADADLRGGLAWIADGASGLGGLRVVNFRDPTLPYVVGSSNDQFGLTAVKIQGRFALAADYFYANAVPIFDLSQLNPQLRAVLDFSRAPSFRDDEGHDLEVRDGLVYLVGARGCCGTLGDDGVNADSALHIGQYLRGEEEAQQNPPAVALPSVILTEPGAGSSILERRTLRIVAHATDDIRVDVVEFLVNGQVVERDFGAPFEINFQVPEGSTDLLLGAVAVDTAGNHATAEEVIVRVVPDGNPTVKFLTPTEGSAFAEGSTFPILVAASDDHRVTEVTVSKDGAVLQTFSAPPYRLDLAIPLGTQEIRLTASARDEVGQTATAEVRVEVLEDESPQVWLVAPVPGRTVLRAALLPVTIGATDDVGVTSVKVFINGNLRAEDTEAPYDFDLSVPATGDEMRLTAIARDALGQETTAESVYPIGGDPLTTMTGVVLLPGGGPATAATVICQGLSAATGSDGRFSISGIPTSTGGRLRCRAAYRSAEGTEYSGISAAVEPVAGGITDVGEIQLRPEAAFLYPGPQLTVYAKGIRIADLNDDEIPDLIAAAGYDGVAVFLGTPNGGYEAVRYLATAGGPADAVVGDFNGDTIPDIATANGGSFGISVLLGNGDGTFQPHIESATGPSPVALAAGDFNEDGRLDLVAASGDLSILLGNGDGTLTLAGTLSGGGRAVQVGDVNQDGHLDLVGAQRQTRSVRIFLGDGTGAFTLDRTVTLEYFYDLDALTIGDLNGDGRLDFATASTYGDWVNVFFRQADGSYLAGPVLSVGNGKDPRGVLATDVDADGDLDLATANGGKSDVSLFLNSGTGSFSGAKVVFTGATPFDLAAGDLNRDGIADLVTADVQGLSLLFGLGNAVFDTDRRYPAAEFPSGLAVGDFNADGAQDVAVASQDSDEVSVLLGRGDGTFAAENRFPTGSQPVDLGTADFNGDGKLDLVTANLSGDSVSLLMGGGDGTFAPPAAFPAGTWPASLRIADVNGDTHPDVAVANQGSNDVSVLLGRGDGTLAPQNRYAAGDYPLDLVVGDFQGDGRLDLVTANADSSDLSLLSGNADGSFGPEIRLALGAELQPYPSSIVASDLDGDGKQDLAVYYLYDYPSNQNFLGILLGNGDGTFQPLQATPAGPNPFGVMRSADVNGDGIPDLVSTSPGGGATQDILIALGRGDGTFSEPQRYAVGCGPYYLAFGDFNGDGQVDLAASTFGCYATYDISILLHH